MKISKTNQKIGAGILLLLLGAFAYSKYGKKKTTATPETEVATLFDKSKTPTEYTVMFENIADSGTKFYTDGKKYFKAAFGPLIKSRAEEITEAEYVKNYVN